MSSCSISICPTSTATLLAKLQADEATHDIPVVILSADATDAPRAPALAAGARAFLTKPIAMRELLELVDELLAPGAW